MARVFISHSSRDNEPAARMKAWLEQQGFDAPFLDFDKHAGIPPGAYWEKTLYREIERSEAVIIIQTPNWLESKWCFAEFTQARALGKAIFPVIETPGGETLIAPDIQALDLRADKAGGLERLSRQLTRIALDAQGGFTWEAGRPPYPGLLAFQEEDAAIYFGRDDDIRRLIERLNARRAQGGAKLVALLGASGSGKSSLLRAGVIPRLKRARRNWIVLPPMRPRARPIDELAQCLAVATDQDWRKLRDDLNAPNVGQMLGDLARDLRNRAAANEAQILLPIDQAEELFGTADPDQARLLFDILTAMLSDDQPFIAVMAIRSDYLGQLQSVDHLNARFEEFSLGPMPLARIPQIIEGPARVAGLRVEDAFVQQAVRDAETADALPLLAFALRELYDATPEDHSLSLAGYNAMGDAETRLSPLENAVRKAADGVLAEAEASDEALTALREAFVSAMVRVNDQGEYVRRPARWVDLPEKAHTLLQRLAGARLLILSQRGDERIVEVAHEALLRKWPRLRAWLDEARDFLAGKQQMESDLRDWERASAADKPDALLAGLKLNRARDWLLAWPQRLSDRERSYILASIAQADRTQQRRLRQRRAVTWGFAGLSLAAMALAGWALWNGKLAGERAEALDDAFGRALGTAAQSRTDRVDADNAPIAAALAVEGWRRSRTTDAWAAAQRLPVTGIVGAVAHRNAVRAVAFSPDGTLLATGSQDATARLVEASTGNQRQLVKADREVVSVAFSADSRFWATGDSQGIVRVLDTTTGSEVALLAHESAITTLAFSPKSEICLLATGSNTGTVRLVEIPSGKPVGQVQHEGPVHALAFSRDARLLATGSDRTARLIDTSDALEIAHFDHGGHVRSVAISPDGALLATGSDDANARVFNVSSLREDAKVLHVGPVLSVDFSPDSRLLATGSEDHLARLILRAEWKVASNIPHSREVGIVRFSPDGRWLATGSGDGFSRLIDVGSRQEVARTKQSGAVDVLAFSPNSDFLLTGSQSLPSVGAFFANLTAIVPESWIAHTGHTSPLSGTRTRLIFSADGSAVLALGMDGEGAPLFDAKTGERRRVTQDNNIWAANLSPDGRLLATAVSDETATLVELPSGNAVAHLSAKLAAFAFSPDGRLVAEAGADGIVRLFKAADRTEQWRTEVTGKIRDVNFSPGGQLLGVTIEDQGVRLISVATGKEVSRLPNLSTTEFVISPDGQRLVNDTASELFDTATGQSIAPLANRGWVLARAFSPDSRFLATGSKDNVARIFETASGKEIARVVHEDMVRGVAFSADSRAVATVGKDNVARVVEAETGKEIMRITLTDESDSVAFSPDGKVLATGGENGVSFWSLDRDHVFAHLCRQPGLNLSLSDWSRYVGKTSWRPTCECWSTPPDVVEAGLWPPKDRALDCGKSRNWCAIVSERGLALGMPQSPTCTK